MIEINGTDDLVAAAIRTLADWDEAMVARCSRHGHMRQQGCPECALLGHWESSSFNRLKDLAFQIRRTMVLT